MQEARCTIEDRHSLFSRFINNKHVRSLIEEAENNCHAVFSSRYYLTYPEGPFSIFLSNVDAIELPVNKRAVPRIDSVETNSYYMPSQNMFRLITCFMLPPSSGAHFLVQCV